MRSKTSKLGGTVGVTASVVIDGMAAENAVQIHVVGVQVLGNRCRCGDVKLILSLIITSILLFTLSVPASGVCGGISFSKNG